MLARLSITNTQSKQVFFLYLLINSIENYTKTFLLALYQIPALPSHVKTFFQGEACGKHGLTANC